MKTATPAGFPFGALLAFLGPWAATLGQAVTVPLFRSDEAVRAGLEAGPLLQGAPSAFLARWCSALPLGETSGRASVLGGLAAGFAGLFVYRLAHGLASRWGGSSALHSWLALTAAWAATLSTPWLTEGVVIGGAAPGAFLALGLVLWSRATARSEGWQDEVATRMAAVLPRQAPRALAGALAFGMLLGTLAAESVWAAAAPCVFLAFEPSRRSAWSWLGVWGGAVVALAVWLLPCLSGATPPATWVVELGPTFPWSPITLVDHVGIVLALGAVGALAWGLPRARSGMWPIALVLLLDWFAPLAAESALSTLEALPSRHALHLVALGLWAATGSVGLGLLCETAKSRGLYGASAAAPLTAVLGFTAALAGAEDAVRRQSEIPLRGARLVSDESLGSLPARAIVLTHSAVLTSRLLTAQSGRERPDVLIVPLSKLGEVTWMHDLLRAEPRLSQLVRDLNVMGTPSEHALNLLADERPVFVEADASWDRRLLEHLAPSPLLAEFSPHALGRSDRIQSWQAGHGTMSRLRDHVAIDPAAGAFLDTQLAQLEAALVKAGDRTFALTIGAARFLPAQGEQSQRNGPSENPASPEASSNSGGAEAPLRSALAAR